LKDDGGSDHRTAFQRFRDNCPGLIEASLAYRLAYRKWHRLPGRYRPGLIEDSNGLVLSNCHLDISRGIISPPAPLKLVNHNMEFIVKGIFRAEVTIWPVAA